MKATARLALACYSLCVPLLLFGCGDADPSPPPGAMATQGGQRLDQAGTIKLLSVGLKLKELEDALRNLPREWDRPSEHRFTLRGARGETVIGVTVSAAPGTYALLFKDGELAWLAQLPPTMRTIYAQTRDDMVAFREWMLNLEGPFLTAEGIAAQFNATTTEPPSDNDVSWLTPLTPSSEKSDQRDAQNRYAQLVRTYDGRKIELGMSIESVLGLFPSTPERRNSGIVETLIYNQPLLDARWYPGILLEIEFQDGKASSVTTMYTPGEFARRSR